MEQCVARLDVAMFNAILRESANEIPTDPVADPISDAEVLPIPAGKASFGAGAQLKNAVSIRTKLCLTHDVGNIEIEIFNFCYFYDSNSTNYSEENIHLQMTDWELVPMVN